MSYYIGTSPSEVQSGFIKRYFYGLRRNDDGELFLVVVDQLRGGDENVVIVNDLGVAEDNYPDFEEGIDVLDGIDINKDVLYPNLRYPQFSLTTDHYYIILIQILDSLYKEFQKHTLIQRKFQVQLTVTEQTMMC